MNPHSMAEDRPRGLRGFVQTGPGKAFLVAFSALTVTGTFAYVSPLLAIPVFLFVGLGLPILLGVKRPRFLAVSGLVVLLVVAPIGTVVFTNTILTPVPAVSSSPLSPDGAGGSVLENAVVSPFAGDSSTNFTWTVTVDTSHLPGNLNGTNWTNDRLELYISTCPGAIDTNASYCGSSYSFKQLTYTFPTNLTAGQKTNVTFHQLIGENGVWAWQMGLVVTNHSGNISRIYLVGDPTWNGIEGPVIGGFTTVYAALIADIYFTGFLYLGLPYYLLLLLYMLLKNRERRRKEAMLRAGQAPRGPSPDLGPQPLSSDVREAAGSPDARSASASGERTCPSCSAVVYPSEGKCWKCGADLSTAVSS